MIRWFEDGNIICYAAIFMLTASVSHNPILCALIGAALFGCFLMMKE